MVTPITYFIFYILHKDPTKVTDLYSDARACITHDFYEYAFIHEQYNSSLSIDSKYAKVKATHSCRETRGFARSLSVRSALLALSVTITLLQSTSSKQSRRSVVGKNYIDCS